MRRIACILAVISGPAFADVTTPGGAPIPCYCTDTEGDRVELYRPLKIDPKQARLNRAKKKA